MTTYGITNGKLPETWSNAAVQNPRVDWLAPEIIRIHGSPHWWHEIEQKDGSLKWDKLDAHVEANTGRKIILSVAGWPPKVTGSVNGNPFFEEFRWQFARYFTEVCKRYRGRIWAYEVFNEPQSQLTTKYGPNLTSWQDEVVVTRVLSETIPILSSIRGVFDSKAKLVGPGFANLGYTAMIELLNRLGTLRYLDAVSLHVYVNGDVPDKPTDATKIHRCLPFREQLIALRQSAWPKPVWITEWGLPDNPAPWFDLWEKAEVVITHGLLGSPAIEEGKPASSIPLGWVRGWDDNELPLPKAEAIRDRMATK